ncbi:hypothetical protein OROGR_004454 [Orobanche gracilis]
MASRKGIWKQLTTRLNPFSTESSKGPPSKSQIKRMKRKLKNNRLQKPGSSSLYLFAHLNTGYVLYKIKYNQLDNTIEQLILNDKEAEPKPLIPLITFYQCNLPSNFCSLVSLGDYLYFVGEQINDIFTVPKFFIENLTPNEKNCGSDFLMRLDPPMNSPKYKPIVFVAKDNLYVISICDHGSSHDFEMYSPSTNSWTVLIYRPNGPYGPFKSHFVVDDTVFFATKALDAGDHDESVLFYNLTDQSWKHLSTSPLDGDNLHPAFEPPVLPIGDMLFGGFSRPNPLYFNSVVASPYSSLDDNSYPDAKYFFMRPTLAPQHKFCLEFDRRHHYVVPNLSASHYMTDMQTLGGENVLSCVSYGYHPTSGDTVVFFNFFKIPHDPLVSIEEDEPLDVFPSCCYGSAVRSYFKSEFMHRKLFKISTNELFVYPGRLITCFSY